LKKPKAIIFVSLHSFISMANSFNSLKKFLMLLLVTPLLLSEQLHAQVSLPNEIKASFTNKKPKIDGVLNDEAWKSAVKINNFTQRELKIGEPATERTEVAVLVSDQHLYVGVWCYDSEPQKIIAKELKRDFNYDLDDNFIIIIDTYHDLRNGFMFVTNPNAARADLQVFNNGGTSNAYWNGVWNVLTTKTDSGWFAEFEIPFYTLKYRSNVAEQIWGINFERNIRRKREQLLWQGWSRDNRIQQLNHAGTLTGLNQLSNNRFVEIKPYATAGGLQSKTDNKLLLNGGGDVNYLLSPTYRLNLTFNTDFAQVEADQQQINITRFPLFFPELREFFLEGEDYFNMGFGGNRIIPFYTRRIGLNEKRETVPIIAGARLLGKESNNTLGIMSIQTAADDGQPSTNYSAISWRNDIGRQSVVGAMSATKFESGRLHTTNAINGRYSTSKFLKNKNLDMGGALIQIYNTDVGIKKGTYAYRGFISYPNDKFSVYSSFQQGPMPFEPEVGLLIRRNFREAFTDISFKPRSLRRFKKVRQYEFKPASVTFTQYDDTRAIQTFEYRIQYFGADLKSGDKMVLNYTVVAEGLINDFEISKGVNITKNTYWWRQWEADLKTFRGRTFALAGNFIWGEFYDGSAFRNRTDLFWRAGKYMNMSVRYELNDVKLSNGSFRTNLVGSRIEYAFNPNLFGSLLSQWNTNQEELNVNFRLRYIPKIGTDLFFIFNQLYTANANVISVKSTTVLAKLVWRFIL
jgi:hypothetical protein